MIQEIIVFIILAVVISYIAYTFFRKPVSKKSTACDGCSGCDLKKDLMCNLTADPPPTPQGGLEKPAKR
jgi:peptidoglycan/LPS O-acetylase OafA/YrhL